MAKRENCKKERRRRRRSKNRINRNNDGMCEVMSDVIVCSLNGYALGIFIKPLKRLARQIQFAPNHKPSKLQLPVAAAK